MKNCYIVIKFILLTPNKERTVFLYVPGIGFWNDKSLKTQELLRATLPKINESVRKEPYRKKVVFSLILLVLLRHLQEKAV